MTIGPLELVVIGFEGDNFRGEIAAELNRVQTRGEIRVIDLVFVRKDSTGQVSSVEVEELEENYRARYGTLLADLRGLLTDEDVIRLSEQLAPNTAAMLMLFEHVWAIGLKEAVRNAGGRLLAEERINPEAVAALTTELEEAMAGV